MKFNQTNIKIKKTTCQKHLALYNARHSFELSPQCLGGEIGRRSGFKIRRSNIRDGSSPSLGTIFKQKNFDKNHLIKETKIKS